MGAPTVADALMGLSAFGRQQAGFSLVEEPETLFRRAYENPERVLAAEFESCFQGILPLAHIRFRFLVGCGSCAGGNPGFAGCDVSKNTFTIFTQVRQ